MYTCIYERECTYIVESICRERAGELVADNSGNQRNVVAVRTLQPLLGIYICIIRYLPTRSTNRRRAFTYVTVSEYVYEYMCARARMDCRPAILTVYTES